MKKVWLMNKHTKNNSIYISLNFHQSLQLQQRKNQRLTRGHRSHRLQTVVMSLIMRVKRVTTVGRERCRTEPSLLCEGLQLWLQLLSKHITMAVFISEWELLVIILQIHFMKPQKSCLHQSLYFTSNPIKLWFQREKDERKKKLSLSSVWKLWICSLSQIIDNHNCHDNCSLCIYPRKREFFLTSTMFTS